MVDQGIEKLKRQLEADPSDAQAQIELAKARARVEGPSVYLEPLNNRLVWNKSSEPLQDLAINEVMERLKHDYDRLETRVYSCAGISHRIASFAHLKTGVILNLIPGGVFLQGTGDIVGLEQLFEACQKHCNHFGNFDEEVMDLEYEQPQHKVKINPFLLARTPVTQKQWDLFNLPDKRNFSSPSLPIERITRQSMREWLKLSNSSFRLPSESEWEYACRAGSSTYWFHGNDVKELESYAWHAYNTADDPNDARLRDVGQKSPNSFGLHDMHGNVYEWCADFHSATYEDAPNDGSPRLEPEASHYVVGVLRGGSYCCLPMDLRSAFRGHFLDLDGEEDFYEGSGFRVAMNLPTVGTFKTS